MAQTCPYSECLRAYQCLLARALMGTPHLGFCPGLHSGAPLDGPLGGVPSAMPKQGRAASFFHVINWARETPFKAKRKMSRCLLW